MEHLAIKKSLNSFIMWQCYQFMFIQEDFLKCKLLNEIFLRSVVMSQPLSKYIISNPDFVINELNLKFEESIFMYSDIYQQISQLSNIPVMVMQYIYCATCSRIQRISKQVCLFRNSSWKEPHWSI